MHPRAVRPSPAPGPTRTLALLAVASLAGGASVIGSADDPAEVWNVHHGRAKLPGMVDRRGW